jgi:hypothetical protein
MRIFFANCSTNVEMRTKNGIINNTRSQERHKFTVQVDICPGPGNNEILQKLYDTYMIVINYTQRIQFLFQLGPIGYGMIQCVGSKWYCLLSSRPLRWLGLR